MERLIKYLALTIIILVSCQTEDVAPEQGGETTSVAQVTFAVQLPGNNLPKARALDGDLMQQVTTIEILAFDPSGNYLYTAYAEPVGTDSPNTRTFTATLRTGDCDLVFLANSRDWIEEEFGGHITPSTPRLEIQQRLAATIDGKWDADPTAGNEVYIPMWAEKNNVTITPNTSFTGSADNIKLTRALARIDVFVDEQLQQDFTLKKIYLYNYYKKGLIIPDPLSGTWSNGMYTASNPSLGSQWSGSTEPIEYSDGEFTDPGVSCVNRIFTFEAPQGSILDASGNTCLVIGGTYKGWDCFYRVDFARTVDGVTTFLPLLRNFKYIVNIKKIASKGFDDPMEAFLSLPTNIQADITTRDDGKVGYFVYDGQYYLGADPSEVNLWAENSTDNQINIVTDYPNGWRAFITETPDPQSAPVDWLEITSVTDNGPGQTGSISYKASENLTGQIRRAFIHFTTGRLYLSVEIIQHDWYITSGTVSPSQPLVITGDTRTVRVSGKFEDLTVRAYDRMTNSVIDTAILPGTSSESEATLVIPEIWINNMRTVAFEYWHSGRRDWQTIATQEQPGYYITRIQVTYNPEYFPQAGATVYVLITGRYPDLMLRMRSDDFVINATAQGYTGLKNHPMIIPANDTGSNRTIIIEWSLNNGETWRHIYSKDQLG